MASITNTPSVVKAALVSKIEADAPKTIAYVDSILSALSNLSDLKKSVCTVVIAPTAFNEADVECNFEVTIKYIQLKGYRVEPLSSGGYGITYDA